MLFRGLALAALSIAPAAMAEEGGGLRANALVIKPAETVDEHGRKLAVVNRFSTFTASEDYEDAINNLIAPGRTCPHYHETWCEAGVVRGLGCDNSAYAPNVNDLRWETTSYQGAGCGLAVGNAFDTRSDGDSCTFHDQLQGAERTNFHHPDMEGWGAYFNLDPLNLGSGLKFEAEIMIDNVVAFIIEAVPPTQLGDQFVGIVSTLPFQKVEVIPKGSQETYDIDDMWVFPWCSPIRGGLKGDPHVKTWTGTYFDWMGECDLVYLHDEEHGIDLHARTTIRREYSYVEQAALRIGNDILEVGSWGQHALNGVDSVFVDGNAVYTVGGYPVYYEQKDKKNVKFDVVLNSQQNITLKVFKDTVSILTDGNAGFFGNSVGLLGSQDGKLVGRDGKTVYDIEKKAETDAFGQEWQVNNEDPQLFTTDRAPQYPAKCTFPTQSEVEESRRRLAESPIEQNAAEMACAHFAGDNFQKCVYDVMAFGDLEIAGAGIY